MVAPFVEVLEGVPAEPVAEEVKVQLIPPRKPREGRSVRRSNVADRPQTALTSAIPARPVVVSASALAKENAAKKEAHPVKPKVVEGTLGAMIRALGQQGAV